MKKKVDWTKPAYDRYSVRQAQRGYLIAHLPCDLCKKPIKVGQRYARGPRGESGAHEDCREQLLELAQKESTAT